MKVAGHRLQASDPEAPGTTRVKLAGHHIESLDVFRGMTIAAMILVNNPGDWTFVFPPLMHEYWTGWTFADVVFPWFIFIMGFAMPFAFLRRREEGHPIPHLHRRIVRRVAMLIVLGLILNSVSRWPGIFPLRFTGILQRIALSYLIAAVIVLHFDVRGWIVAAALLLLGHWAALTLVPFGGYPRGTLTPEHNLAGYVDALVFGRHASAMDAEGLLGVLPSAATAIIGALAGQLVRRRSTQEGRVGTLAIAGASTFAVGELWSSIFPVSKPLWTGSYVLVMTGLAMLLFACTYVIIDRWQLRSWARPFLWLGVNPLALYFLSDVVGHLLQNVSWQSGTGRMTPIAWFFWGVLEPAFHPLSPEWPSLAFAVAYVLVWISVAAVLYHRQIRIQV
jgi:predicted acyltransferase